MLSLTSHEFGSNIRSKAIVLLCSAETVLLTRTTPVLFSSMTHSRLLRVRERNSSHFPCAINLWHQWFQRSKNWLWLVMTGIASQALCSPTLEKVPPFMNGTNMHRPGLHNIRPAGHMRPARSFLAARENSVAENVAKARLRIITCPFRISSTL